MKMSEAFEFAKRFLARDADDVYGGNQSRSMYICHALPDGPDGNPARKLISQRLNQPVPGAPFQYSCMLSYESWLSRYYGHNRPGIDAPEQISRAFYDNIQRARHAWVDQLIAEFKAKGD